MPLPVTFATLATGNQPASLLDQNFAAVANMATTYCTATGTNTILLTVAPNQPTPTGYANGQQFSFLAPATNTGPVTIQVGSLAAIPLRASGAALAAGALIAGTVCTVVVSGNGTSADLISAVQSLNGPLILTNGNGLYLDAASGSPRTIFGRTIPGPANRWELDLGNGTAESSGNVGSDFAIGRYNNAGTIVDAPLTIARSTGVVAIAASLPYNGVQGLIVGGSGINYTQFSSTTVAFQLLGGPLAVWVNGTNLGNMTISSDYRIKRIIAPLPSMWDRVKALKPVSYKHKDFSIIKSDDVERWGFVAHELQETLIEDAASGKKDEENLIQSPNLMTVVASLTRALQEAMARIEKLEAQLARK